MIIENYNNKVKSELRTIATAAIALIESETKADFANTADRRQNCAEILLQVAKKHNLTDYEDIDATWLSRRVYRPDLYKNIPVWVAKASLHYLLSKPTWEPETAQCWLVTMALFVREFGGVTPNYTELVQSLPAHMQNEIGKNWLKNCVDSVLAIQKRKNDE